MIKYGYNWKNNDDQFAYILNFFRWCILCIRNKRNSSKIGCTTIPIEYNNICEVYEY